ncbi:MAG: TlpA family protein disulfide reductase [Planctomycetaceae bacterium]|nr:TlpA family protein disulfide reductase [Planctomycetaceae bacterium]
MLILAGCGGGTTDEPVSTGSTNSTTPPPASIETRPAASEPEPQGPAARIAEIARLRTLPDTVVEVRYENGQRVETGRRDATPEELVAEQKQRLERIVELAGMVIKEIHDDPQGEQIFNNAVHYLTDARMQLAILGDAEEAQQLTQDAEALFQRDATSFAAVESGHKVVQLAESMAARFGAQNRDWVREYANQAQQFARRFPQEDGRTAVSLIAAGRKCEQYGLPDDARTCYLQVEQQFSGSVFAAQIAGILRRLRLEGQPLELAGPTIDGGFFSVDKFAGRPMLVVFWAAGSEPFRRDMAVLKQVSEQYKEPQLTIVGVCLDEQESSVDKFLEEYDVSWRQIFFTDPGQRAGRNPVARYYGVHVTPTYWLVDDKGVVAAAPVSIAELPARVAQLVKAPAAQSASSPAPQ